MFLFYLQIEGWSGFSDLWSGQKVRWKWYLTPVVNFGEVQRTQLAKSTLVTSTLVPLGSFKVCSDAEESGVQKATGSYCTYSIPDKIAALVPEFAIEDLLPAELQSRFLRLQWKTCPWTEHSDDICIAWMILILLWELLEGIRNNAYINIWEMSLGPHGWRATTLPLRHSSDTERCLNLRLKTDV